MTKDFKINLHKSMGTGREQTPNLLICSLSLYRLRYRAKYFGLTLDNKPVCIELSFRHIFWQSFDVLASPFDDTSDSCSFCKVILKLLK